MILWWPDVDYCQYSSILMMMVFDRYCYCYWRYYCWLCWSIGFIFITDDDTYLILLFYIDYSDDILTWLMMTFTVLILLLMIPVALLFVLSITMMTFDDGIRGIWCYITPVFLLPRHSLLLFIPIRADHCYYIVVLLRYSLLQFDGRMMTVMLPVHCVCVILTIRNRGVLTNIGIVLMTYSIVCLCQYCVIPNIDIINTVINIVDDDCLVLMMITVMCDGGGDWLLILFTNLWYIYCSVLSSDDIIIVRTSTSETHQINFPSVEVTISPNTTLANPLPPRNGMLPSSSQKQESAHRRTQVPNSSRHFRQDEVYECRCNHSSEQPVNPHRQENSPELSRNADQLSSSLDFHQQFFFQQFQRHKNRLLIHTDFDDIFRQALSW